MKLLPIPPVKQHIPLEQLPAFSTNSNVQFFLDIPGLNISITLGPCKRFKEPGELKEFKLNYDPSRFWKGSLIRRTLGTEKLEYAKEDIRQYNHSHLFDVGAIVEFFLKHPKDTDRTLPDGPLMFISRENGQILFYPTGTKSVYFSFREYMGREVQEFLRNHGKQFKGSWDIVETG